MKSEGYDGNDSQNESASQWNFSGALLYSVTIITTIGKYIFIYLHCTKYGTLIGFKKTLELKPIVTHLKVKKVILYTGRMIIRFLAFFTKKFMLK